MSAKQYVTALLAGRSVENPKGWKYAQIATSILAAVAVWLQSKGWIDTQLGVDDIVGLASLFNAYATVISSDRIGLLPARVMRDSQPMPPRDYAPAGVSGSADPAKGGDEFSGHFNEH